MRLPEEARQLSLLRRIRSVRRKDGFLIDVAPDDTNTARIMVLRRVVRRNSLIPRLFADEEFFEISKNPQPCLFHMYTNAKTTLFSVHTDANNIHNQPWLECRS